MKIKILPSSSQCQLYLDVDCSDITYDSQPSAVVLDAVNKTLLSKKASRQASKSKTKSRRTEDKLHNLESSGSGDSENEDETNDTEDEYDVELGEDDYRENEDIALKEDIKTINLLSQDEVLANSLLSSIDPRTASKSEIKEARRDHLP